MNGIIGMTDLALDTELDETQRLYLGTVKNSAQSLLVILSDILDFSKIESGKLEVERVGFDISSLFNDVLRSVEARATEKKLGLIRDIPTDLPSLVIGDPGRIRQVLTNLCDNAIKFTHQGELEVRLNLSITDADHFEAQVSVRDTGIGIAEEKKELIFESFSQADTSTTREFGGTGLGLTICAGLVELLGGKIWVESEVGKGSTFHFKLPLGRDKSDSVEQIHGEPVKKLSPHASAVNNTSVKNRKLRVLVAEDNPVNQLVITSLLRKWGHEVVVADNGAAAVELFSNSPWELVLMDMQMPTMGGIEATQLIRAQEQLKELKRTPIVAVTANARPEDRQACLDAGMDDFLAKPLDQELLAHIINDWVPGNHLNSSEPSPTAEVKAKDKSGDFESEPHIDLKRLSDYVDDDQEMVKELLTVFRKSLIDIPQRLDAAISDKNNKQLMKIAHELKGSSASLFAMKLASIAKNAETYFRGDRINWDEAARIVELIKSETEELSKILQSEA
jgi:CheY-like chemotaxis protein